MAKVNDGGAAFPLGMGFNGANVGMSLRDYFAGQALPSILIAFTPSFSDDLERAAVRAYQAADAMIAEKEKSK